MNSCRSNPCQNQGTCQNIIDSYKCVCSRSFTGAHCETGKEFNGGQYEVRV